MGIIVQNGYRKIKIELKFEDIRIMTKDNFLKIVKSKLSENALEYLLNKR